MEDSTKPIPNTIEYESSEEELDENGKERDDKNEVPEFTFRQLEDQIEAFETNWFRDLNDSYHNEEDLEVFHQVYT